jgi:hypothetical protein
MDAKLMSDARRMSDITRPEWITYEWIDRTLHGDSERMLLQGHMRTPEEGAKAADDWDKWIDAAQFELRLEGMGTVKRETGAHCILSLDMNREDINISGEVYGRSVPTGRGAINLKASGEWGKSIFYKRIDEPTRTGYEIIILTEKGD